MKIRVALHEVGGNILIGNPFDSEAAGTNFANIGTSVVIALTESRKITTSEIENYWSRISLVDAYTLKEEYVIHQEPLAWQGKRYSTDRLNELLHEVTDELEKLSSSFIGESEEYDGIGAFTFLYQDVSLLKHYRQCSAQPQLPSFEADQKAQGKQKTASHIQPPREWKVQICSTQPGSIYQFCISHLNGAIQETTGNEYRTSETPSDTQNKQS